jgi:phage terminase large subunit-like protein
VLTVTAGMKVGQPFHLLDWTLFCTGNLFGWHRESGRLRFRHGWLETGKGQAKSPFMAAVGLYCGGFRGVQRAECYAIAWDKDQANVPFKDAVAMCRADMPDHDEGVTLESLGKVVIRGTLDNAWKIEFPDSNSKFQSLANGENISGPRPCFVLADEIHEFKSGDPIETWKAAIAKQAGDAFMLLGTNTPASTQITGTQYSTFYQKVVTGEHIDDEAFGFIARVDKADDPFEDEKCWPKALPALGVTFPAENIRGQVASAKVLLSTQMSVKRLYFGIPVGTIDFWIDEQAWASCLGEVAPNEFKGCPCWLSLDLSQKNDLTALTAIWLKGGELYAKTWYWTTASGLKERALKDNAPYPVWVEQKLLTAVPGAVIDKTYVAAEVKEIVATHDVQMLAFDPAGAADFVAACEQIGFPVWQYEGPDKPEGEGLKLVRHAQGTRVVFEERNLCMPRSIERLEDKILNAGIVIDNSPVTYMCAANAALVSDGQKNRAFDKKRSRGRIDGLVTIAMGVGAATMVERDTSIDLDALLAGPAVFV